MAKKYKNIPVDAETYEMVEKVAKLLGFGERGLGAAVRIMAKEKYAGLLAAQLLGQSVVSPAASASMDLETR
ncbi:MAG: hypothetical protein WA821_00385 [Anaerolineales bacterium]